MRPPHLLALLVFCCCCYTKTTGTLNEYSNAHWLSKRKSMLTGCDHFQHEIVEGVGEVIEMLEVATKRLEVLKYYLEQSIVPPVWTMTEKLASTFRTYVSFMNCSLDTRGSPQSGRRAQPRMVLGRTILRMARIRQSLLDGSKLEVFCGDDWLQPTNLKGKDREVVEDGRVATRWYFDKRKSVSSRENHNRKWVSFRSQNLPFWINEHYSPIAYSIGARMAGPRTAVVVLNPRWRWESAATSHGVAPGESSFPIMRKDRTYTPCMLCLGNLVVRRHVSLTLLHEFSHLAELTGQDLELVDVALTAEEKAALDIRDSYGLRNSTKLALYRPDLAAKNVDNFVYLTLALYLDNYDWSIAGWNRPLRSAFRD